MPFAPRSNRLASVLIALLLGGGIPLTEALAQAGDGRPPNVIFILADDLGYGDLGSYGQHKIQTPRLDQMAEEGMRFTQFYAGSTVCAPSRWSLMTGTHMGHAYVRGNADSSLRDEDATLPKTMQEAGYATGLFGKWGLGLEDDSGAPHRQGFNEFLGYLEHVHAHSYYTDHLFAIRDSTTQRVEIDTTEYTHDLFAESALEFIEAHQEEPFFLYLPFTIAHAELLVPEEAMQPYLKEDGTSALMPDAPFPCCGVIGTYRGQDRPHAAFAGMVTHLDRDVGRILDKLTELGLDENTVVLFTSDNGPHDEGGADPGFFESNGPLRGLKRDLYEGGIRVPMIAWGPGLVPAGQTSNHVWAMWDVLPTVADLAQVEAPDSIDGLSMANVLRGEGAQLQHPHLYWEFNNTSWGGHYAQALRQGDWKLLRFREPDGDQWAELYDLSRDASEYNDLAEHYPDVVERLTALMQEVRTTPENPRFEIPY